MAGIATRWLCAAGVGWLGLCGLGTGVLWSYGQQAGDPGLPGDAWALDDALPLASDRPTLVMFAHPKCPCSAASLSAIERLTARHEGRLASVLVLFEPDGADASWREGGLWRRARSIPGLSTVTDSGGRLTARAGATTSGVAGLYAPDGRLMFWGGLTPSRGHEGDSLGLDAVAAALRGERHDAQAAVYGCSILGTCAGDGCEGDAP